MCAFLCLYVFRCLSSVVDRENVIVEVFVKSPVECDENWCRALGWHGTDGSSCHRPCLVPARHEKLASCSWCASSAARSAGTARARMSSCPFVLMPIVPGPIRARVVLCWVGQMAMYSCCRKWNTEYKFLWCGEDAVLDPVSSPCIFFKTACTSGS
jgi:hypothetical protein